MFILILKKHFQILPVIFTVQVHRQKKCLCFGLNGHDGRRPGASRHLHADRLGARWDSLSQSLSRQWYIDAILWQKIYTVTMYYDMDILLIYSFMCPQETHISSRQGTEWTLCCGSNTWVQLVKATGNRCVCVCVCVCLSMCWLFQLRGLFSSVSFVEKMLISNLVAFSVHLMFRAFPCES